MARQDGPVRLTGFHRVARRARRPAPRSGVTVFAGLDSGFGPSTSSSSDSLRHPARARRPTAASRPLLRQSATPESGQSVRPSLYRLVRRRVRTRRQDASPRRSDRWASCRARPQLPSGEARDFDALARRVELFDFHRDSHVLFHCPGCRGRVRSLAGPRQTTARCRGSNGLGTGSLQARARGHGFRTHTRRRAAAAIDRPV
jgi:hypothetical protein